MGEELGGASAVARWAAAEELRLCRLEHLERDGVHIQCVDSTDFVVGRQTNFNGPVTIISCADVLKNKKFFEGGGSPGESGVVIQENVMSQAAAKRMQEMAAAEESLEEGELQKSMKPKRNWPKKTAAFVCLGLVAASTVTSVALLTMTTQDLPTPRKCTPLAANICLYSEFEWGGRPNSSDVLTLELPVSCVVVSQTDDDGYCYNYNVCLESVRLLQQDRDPDAACNFLLGGEGNVYADRGWSHQTAPRPLSHALVICFMGEFLTDYPTYPQVQAAEALLRFGVENGYVARDYALLSGNASAPILHIIRKWPGFREGLPSASRRRRISRDEDLDRRAEPATLSS